MLGRNICLAALIAVAVHVTAVHAASSICSKAEECYVNGSSSKVCNRTEKKCNRCLSEKESDSMLAALGAWTEYNCYAYDDEECPSGTTECPATLTTSDEEENSASSDGSEEAGTSDEDSTSTSTSTSSSTKKKSSSSSSDSSKSTNSSTSTKKKTTTSSSSEDSSSSSSTTSKTTKPSTTTKPTTKPTTKKTTKPATSSSSSSESLSGDSSSASDSVSASASTSASTSSSGGSNSTSKSSAGSSASEDHSARTSSVSATVAPTQATSTKSTTADSALNDDNSKSATTASADTGAGGMNWGLILGIVGGACALVAVAGFVVWKKKQDEDESDDEDAAFSPNKPTYPAGRTMAAPPTASNATTAYTAQPNYNNYGNNYNSNYAESNYSSNYATSTQYAAGAGAAGMVVPASYGSPSSIDIDADNTIRRTDSILGGTGIMSSTTSSEQTPFEFSGGPSPAGNNANREVWGTEPNDFRQKRTASNVSVEF